jgi:recombinational DNA repair ATPase RecF
MAEDVTRKLESLKKRAEAIEKKKTVAETELKYLEEQYNTTAEELKQMGVENLTDLPGLITQYTEEITKQLADIETSLTDIESKVQ